MAMNNWINKCQVNIIIFRKNILHAQKKIKIQH
jgi:hypothetical protein